MDFEIPYLVTVTIPESIKVHMLIQRYHQMVKELRCAPKEEVIIGSFLEQIVTTEDERRPKKKKTTLVTKKTEKPKWGKDIRNFSQNAVRPRSIKDSIRTIVID